MNITEAKRLLGNPAALSLRQADEVFSALLMSTRGIRFDGIKPQLEQYFAARRAFRTTERQRKMMKPVRNL